MKNILGYKISNAYFLPYKIVIDENIMDNFDKNEPIIATSRIYLICKIPKKMWRGYGEPEILYVGETFNKKNRFSQHKKLLEATTLLNNKDILGVYFLQIRCLSCSYPILGKNPQDILKDLSDLNSSASIRLIERFFIYLFNPPLNKNHTTFPIFQDRLVEELLRANEIRYLHIDIGMTGKGFQFWSKSVLPRTDFYYYDLAEKTINRGIPQLF